MNVSENSNVLSGAEYHFYTGWVLTGEIFQSSVSDWLALTILPLNMKLNTNYRVYCLYWNWSSALLGNNHCNNGFKHILNYWLCSTTDPSVYFIHEIGILEIRFEFGNWFVKEYFWWMICVAVTVSCGISAGWLKSLINITIHNQENNAISWSKWKISNQKWSGFPATNYHGMGGCLSQNPYTLHLKPGAGGRIIVGGEKNIFQNIL